jgi:tetratricopeptide (TPR) repeat protein
LLGKGFYLGVTCFSALVFFAFPVTTNGQGPVSQSDTLLFYKGKAALSQNDCKAALAAFSQLATSMGHNPNWWLNTGAAEACVGNYDLAVKLLTFYDKVNPSKAVEAKIGELLYAMDQQKAAAEKQRADAIEAERQRQAAVVQQQQQAAAQAAEAERERLNAIQYQNHRQYVACQRDCSSQLNECFSTPGLGRVWCWDTYRSCPAQCGKPQ